jgi:hypothetical protein
MSKIDCGTKYQFCQHRLCQHSCQASEIRQQLMELKSSDLYVMGMALGNIIEGLTSEQLAAILKANPQLQKQQPDNNQFLQQILQNWQNILN